MFKQVNFKIFILIIVPILLVFIMAKSGFVS